MPRRHLWVDLDKNKALKAPEGALDGWGGVASAHLALAEGFGGFQLAVGPAVVRGLATSARASVLGRSPLTGRATLGQIGQDLAARFAPQLDRLALSGRSSIAGAVLVIEEGDARVESFPELAGLSGQDVHSRLLGAFGDGSSLRVGPAGEAGSLFANLATGDVNQSFVGRGLGALFASHGLKAIHVVGEPGEGAQEDALVDLLARSPRLLERARGGSFELAGARQAAGESGDQGAHDLDASTRRGRHGCRGCPTPCGWTFEAPSGGVMGARFSAVHALGAQLGRSAEDAMALLEQCNRYGLDAKEASAVLALEGGDPFEALSRAARGELGPVGRADGEATRDENDPVTRLGTHVSPRGAEPMRFSLALGRGESVAERLVFEEALLAAIDASGFCSFAAAGLLGDGVLDLDDLASSLDPGCTGAELLHRGEVLVNAFAEANRSFGQARGSLIPTDLESDAQDYLRRRGFDQEGFPSVSTGDVLARGPRSRDDRSSVPSAIQPVIARETGEVTFECTGTLADLTGSRWRLTTALPAGIDALLAAAAEERPDAAGLLLTPAGQALPAVYRRGQRLTPGDEILAGDELQLVLVVAGG